MRIIVQCKLIKDFVCIAEWNQQSVLDAQGSKFMQHITQKYGSSFLDIGGSVYCFIATKTFH